MLEIYVGTKIHNVILLGYLELQGYGVTFFLYFCLYSPKFSQWMSVSFTPRKKSDI